MKASPDHAAHFAAIPTRRAVLKGGVAGAAAVGIAPTVWAAPRTASSRYLFLLDRATFGYSAEAFDELRSMGWEDWLEWQLDWESIDDSACDNTVKAVAPTVNMTPWAIYLSFKDIPFMPFRMAQLAYAVRGWLSKRQLFYRMSEFWTNVFSTHLGMMNQEWLWTPYNETLIPHALGRFRDLLQASAEGASMLFYLNQDQSDATNPIENYARELLELHTLGLSDDPNKPTYTEQDVVEAARILTGWTFMPQVDDQYGNFVFDAAKHDFGQKVFKGVTYPTANGPGQAEGDDLLTQVSRDPATSVHIANRLIGHFIMDDPPIGYRDSVAKAFRDSNGDIKATVRALFRPAVFGLTDRVKARRPFYLATAFLRATQPLLTGPNLPTHLQRMGHSPGLRSTPDGFPTENEAWYDNLHPRLVFANSAAYSGIGFTLSDGRLDELFPPGEPVAQQANRVLAGGALPAAEVAWIQAALDQMPAGTDLRRDAIALTLSAPSYQFHLA